MKESDNDEILLREFCETGDPVAFEQLVQRYSPMVLGIGQRILSNRSDAEDACQYVFGCLARDARKIQDPRRLGSWLYIASRRRALRLKKMNKRQSERSAAYHAEMRSQARVEGGGWSDVADHIDGAVARLPQSLREVVISCYFRGASYDEAAIHLAVSPDTVRGRFERAREKMRRYLSGRGVTVSGAVLATMLIEHSPAELGKNAIEGLSREALASGGAVEGGGIPLFGGGVKAAAATGAVLILTVGSAAFFLMERETGGGAIPGHIEISDSERANSGNGTEGGESPDGVVMASGSGTESEVPRASYEEFLGRLLEIARLPGAEAQAQALKELGVGLDASDIESAVDADLDWYATEVFWKWAEKDPMGLLRWAYAKDFDDRGRGEMVSAIRFGIPDDQPELSEKALAFIRENEFPISKEEEFAILAKIDLLSAAEGLKDVPSSEVGWPATRVAGQWRHDIMLQGERSDPFAWVIENLEGDAATRFLDGLLLNTTSDDLFNEYAFAAVDPLREAGFEEQASLALSRSAWHQIDKSLDGEGGAREAKELFDQFPLGVQEEIAEKLAFELACNNDFNEAVSWLEEVSDRPKVFAIVLEEVIEEGFEEDRDWTLSLYDSYLSNETDLELTKALIRGALSAFRADMEVGIGIVERIASQEGYVMSLKDAEGWGSENRDGDISHDMCFAIYNMIMNSKSDRSYDPEKAMTVIDRMPFEDNRVREHFIAEMIEDWSRESPAEAQAWLEANKEITPVGRRDMLARIEKARNGE